MHCLSGSTAISVRPTPSSNGCFHFQFTRVIHVSEMCAVGILLDRVYDFNLSGVNDIIRVRLNFNIFLWKMYFSDKFLLL